MMIVVLFFFQAEDGIRDGHVTGVQTCALPILRGRAPDDGGGDLVGGGAQHGSGVEAAAGEELPAAKIGREQGASSERHAGHGRSAVARRLTDHDCRWPERKNVVKVAAQVVETPLSGGTSVLIRHSV